MPGFPGCLGRSGGGGGRHVPRPSGARPPLAEGESVDLGASAGVSSAKASSCNADLSPNVQHSRQWLRALMARHQFDNLPDACWQWVPQAAPQPVANINLAAR